MAFNGVMDEGGKGEERMMLVPSEKAMPAIQAVRTAARIDQRWWKFEEMEEEDDVWRHGQEDEESPDNAGNRDCLDVLNTQEAGH